MTLTLEDQYRLEAASGFIELGLHLDANDELERVSAELRSLPQVLVFRLQIYRALKKWPAMQAVAKKLAISESKNPRWWIAWAEATREADCIADGRLILVNALEHHPESAEILYDLACYDCQLGDLTSAKERLHRAFELEPGLRLKALEDEDFESLWTYGSLYRGGGE
jgi:tetratricopeptide (TPR) repeat protein